MSASQPWPLTGSIPSIIFLRIASLRMPGATCTVPISITSWRGAGHGEMVGAGSHVGDGHRLLPVAGHAVEHVARMVHQVEPGRGGQTGGQAHRHLTQVRLPRPQTRRRRSGRAGSLPGAAQTCMAPGAASSGTARFVVKAPLACTGTRDAAKGDAALPPDHAHAARAVGALAAECNPVARRAVSGASGSTATWSVLRLAPARGRRKALPAWASRSRWRAAR